MKSAFTTADMIKCNGEAYDLWDAELYRVYTQLKQGLPEDKRDILKSSQLEWIKFRDKEFNLIDTYYLEIKQGTMFRPKGR